MMNIFVSKLPDLIIPDISVGRYVLQDRTSNISLKNKTAIIDGSNGTGLTYAEIEAETAALAGGLLDLGGNDSSVIALIAPNCPSFAVAFYAVLHIGASVTTVNPAYTKTEMADQFADCKPLIAFTVSMCLENVLEAAVGTSLQHIILIDGESSDVGDDVRQAHQTIYSWDEVRTDPIDEVPIDVHSTVAALPYSSGTSGKPKGVVLTHHNLVANLIQTRSVLGLSDTDVTLAVLPFFHIYGMQILMNCLIAEGVLIVTMPRFEIEKALELIEKYKVTRLFTVPPMILALAKHDAVENYDISSVRKISCGAAPLGQELAAEASNRVGCPVIQGFGMTELSPVSHLTVGDDFKSGSCGIQVANTECRIVSAEGEDLGIDEIGELWIRGPQVMQGYLNNPKDTSECLDEQGWLHTGDIARIDSDGHMYIVDRLKELIKCKGFQVAPAELEDIIVSHPSVSDAAVIGIPDTRSGEVPKAFVKLKDNCNASALDIQEFVAHQVSSYKQIHQVEFVANIPKSASGKIIRRLLKSDK